MGISDLNSKEQLQRNFQQASFFHQNGQLNKAQDIYLKILETHPNHFDSLYSLGIIACQTVDFQRAVDLFAKAIIANPNNAFLYSNLSAALIELKQLDLAVTNYDKAIALDPNNADYHYNRATILQELKQLDLALASYDRAIELNSGDADYYYNRGCVLQKLRKLDLAVDSYNKSIYLKPDHIESYINCSNSLLDLKQPELAITFCSKAVQLNSNCAEAHENFGNILTKVNRIDLAIISYEKALKLNLNYKFLLGMIFFVRNRNCDWKSYDENLKKLEDEIKKGEQVSGPFPILSLYDSLSLQNLVTEIYAKYNYPISNILGSIPKRSISKKIRIGYYSADFKNHPVAYLTAGLYEAHDRERFEIYAFSFSDIKDAVTSRIEAGVDHFYDVSKISDKDITLLSRNLEIDIAIDLGGYTENCRTEIFAMRAAPIQTSYIGYLGTMSASYFDYLIADKIIIPTESQKYYSEKIVYLPSYQVNDSKASLPINVVTRKEFGLPETGFVFCCFNNTYKITPHVFDSWVRILKRVDNSVLFIYIENELAESNLKKEIILRGLNINRFIFGKRVSMQEYLARYRATDLFLDTLPYNAGTTASDALRMGLPVLTCMGESFASRMAASLLNSLDLPELITKTKEEYENLAIELATNPEKLKSIKEKLEKNRLTTPLFNTKIFTNHIEAAYEAMYDRYQNDLLPDHIEVKDLSLNT